MIEKILPNTETKLRLLRIIFENPDINLSGLIKQGATSPNLVLKYVNSLVYFGVLEEKRYGGSRKTHIRNLKASLRTELGISLFSFVEIEKRLNLVKKYKWLSPFMVQLKGALEGNVGFCLLYGSFARLAADKDSDLDLWLVGSPSEELQKRISEIFSTLDREYSVKVEKPGKFLKNINDPIHHNILKSHIVIYNERNFLKILSKAY